MSDVVLHPRSSRKSSIGSASSCCPRYRCSAPIPSIWPPPFSTGVVYPGSPYGLPSEGTLETASKFDRDSIVKFHAGSYVPMKR